MSSAPANKKKCKIWEAEQLAKAVSFTSVTFLGFPAGYDVRHSTTLKEARRVRRQMLAEYKNNNFGRGVSIYAITINNATVHVE